MQNLTGLSQTAEGYICINKTNDLYIAWSAGAPTTLGTAIMGKGSFCIDVTNGKFYVQGGTKATPAWKLVTSAA